MNPYTYIIKHKPTGKLYYGYRGANKVEAQEDLWKNYFTSSKKVKELIEQDGADSFDFEIRKVFETQEQASDWERKALRRLKVLYNDKWLNQNIAGHVVQTEESRRKISERFKGIPLTEEHKRKVSEAQKGKPKKSKVYQSKEYRENMSRLKSGKLNGRYGLEVSEETRNKISQANKGRPAHNKGKPMSEEQKEKLRQHRKNHSISEETRRKMSEAAKRRKISPETRKKMGLAQRGKIVPKTKCPHCQKEVANNTYFRWHGDNCKEKR